MGKTKLGIFAENLDGGGVEKILQTILHHFNYDRYEVTLFTVRHVTFPAALTGLPIKTAYAFDTYKGGALHRLKTKVLNKIKILVYYHCSPGLFYKLFVRKKFDVAIAFIEGYATRIVSGAPDSVKRIAWLHTEIVSNHWTGVAFRSSKEEMSCYKRFRQVVCVSQIVKRQADALFDIQEKTTVLYNPIDKESIIRLSSDPIQGESRNHPGNKLILSVGRLEQEKGFDRLIRIAHLLLRDGFEFELWIMGEGSLYLSLASLIRNLGLESRVRLLGYKSNPYPFFKECDFYVCPSFAEGFNTAITEALLLGKPVVSTDCSGVREQLGDSVYGIITDNDENALYEGIRKMLDPATFSYFKEMVTQKREPLSLDSSMNAIYHLIDE